MKPQQRRGPVSSRLGPLKVKVANNLAFDARQKIKQKQQQPAPSPTNKQSIKVRIGNNPARINPVQDARQKIMHKTKFVDARVRIQNKQGDSAKTSAPSDMRIKINNAKSKKGVGQGSSSHQNGGYSGATQVTVTGQGRLLTKPGGGVQQVNGSLVKVITQPRQQAQQQPPPIRIQGQLKSPEERQNRFQAKATAPIRVTKNYSDVSSPPASSLIRVRNEFYQPPVQAPPVFRTQPQHREQRIAHSAAAAGVDMGMEYVPQILPEHFDVAPPQATHSSSSYQTDVATFRKTVQNVPPAAVPYTAGPSAAVAAAAPPKMFAASAGTDTARARVLITNLHPVVTEEDVIELFSVAGELKKVRMLREGTAEVVYSTREHAISAVRKYNKRELDGMPMSVQLVSSQPAPAMATRLAASPPPPAPAPQPQKAAAAATATPEHQPLRLYKPPARGAAAATAPATNIDITAIHKALFKTKEPGPAKPVTFTVKI